MDVKSAEILLPGSLITITFPSPALEQQVSWVSQLDIADELKTLKHLPLIKGQWIAFKLPVGQGNRAPADVRQLKCQNRQG